MAPGARELVAERGELVGVVQVEQPVELGERLGVVVDAQVDARAPRLAGGRDDEQRRGLAPAHVAAVRLGRVQRREQAAGERAGRRLEGVRHRRPDLRPGHHVRLRAEPLAALVPGEGDAALAGVHRDAPWRVDHRDLPVARLRVGGELRGECLVRRLPAASRSSSRGP